MKEVNRLGSTYCSGTCRNKVLRPHTSERSMQLLLARTRTSPDAREGFRLRAAGVPVTEWPEAARKAYNDYIQERRKKKADEEGRTPVSDEIREAFRLVTKGIPAEEWPVSLREAYRQWKATRREQ